MLDFDYISMNLAGHKPTQKLGGFTWEEHTQMMMQLTYSFDTLISQSTTLIVYLCRINYALWARFVWLLAHSIVLANWFTNFVHLILQLCFFRLLQLGCSIVFVPVLNKMGQTRPIFFYFRPFPITMQIQIKKSKALMLCLGFEPWAAGW